MKRNADGTWRNSRSPRVVSERVVRARWVEAEALRMQTMAFSYDAIAEHITKVGLGQAQALTTMPEIAFPPDYKISRQACHEACQRALERNPALEAEELRKLLTARCEDLFLNLQPTMRKGNPRASDSGARLIELTARLNGLFVPQAAESAKKKDGRTTVAELLAEVGQLGDED